MILDTVYKRKSFAITLVILLIIILLMFLSGMKYMNPPQEKGIAITFGTTSVGMGPKQPTAPAKPVQEEVKEQPKEPEAPTQTSVPQEEVVTQNTDDAPVIPKAEKKKPQKVEKPKPEPQKETEKPKEPEKPKPSAQTTDALANILGASKKTDAQSSNSGQGDDNTSGHKGSLDGNPYSNSYYGTGGSGTSGNRKGWGLNGRNLESGQKIPQDCNEFGRVVVEIEVDRTGKVVKTKAGVRGTTNSHPCLLEAAEKTAKTYRWNQDDKAPQRQIGFIEINFRLGE